ADLTRRRDAPLDHLVDDVAVLDVVVPVLPVLSRAEARGGRLVQVARGTGSAARGWSGTPAVSFRRRLLFHHQVLVPRSGRLIGLAGGLRLIPVEVGADLDRRF